MLPSSVPRLHQGPRIVRLDCVESDPGRCHSGATGLIVAILGMAPRPLGTGAPGVGGGEDQRIDQALPARQPPPHFTS